ncbi:MAG: prepilin-type N-terminal cleavage/methylation domain-containing protein [Candidatus Microsaccharimonas sp.]
MKSISTKGFTIVEIIVVVTVIAILIGLVTVGMNRYLADGRDGQRKADVSILGEYLENYYEDNGEYPSCDMLTADPTIVANGTLKGIALDALRSPSGATANSIICSNITASTAGDPYAYIGSGCGTAGTGYCMGWTLKYIQEIDSTVVSISSRRS